jgi:adenylyl-sulfate kinase
MPNPFFGTKMKYTIWFTGLPCSGKTTLAEKLYERLDENEKKGTSKLDGDIVRKWLNHDLGFSEEDRRENLRRVALLSRFLNGKIGKNVLASFVSPLNSYREEIKGIIGDGFKLVYVKSHPIACERRDIKGMYAKAHKGIIRGFTGVDAPFEMPARPDLIVDTSYDEYPYGDMPIEQSLERLVNYWNSLKK